MEELVYVSTDDGFLLEGLLVRPNSGRAAITFVWVHGNAARFYDYGYVAACRALAERGYTALSVNTRGHDIAAFLWRAAAGRPLPWRGPQDMPTGGGSAWERLEDAPRDIAAWVNFAAQGGDGRVVLVGHSSGAQRVVLYQAERTDAHVIGLALASPDLEGFLAPGELETARQMVAEGRGHEVLPALPFAPFYRQSAASVVSRTAVIERLATDIPSIACPVLAFFGEREMNAATLLDRVGRRFTGASEVQTRLIANADHAYVGADAEVAVALDEWATKL